MQIFVEFCPVLRADLPLPAAEVLLGLSKHGCALCSATSDGTSLGQKDPKVSKTYVHGKVLKKLSEIHPNSSIRTSEQDKKKINSCQCAPYKYLHSESHAKGFSFLYIFQMFVALWTVNTQLYSSGYFSYPFFQILE